MGAENCRLSVTLGLLVQIFDKMHLNKWMNKYIYIYEYHMDVVREFLFSWFNSSWGYGPWLRKPINAGHGMKVILFFLAFIIKARPYRDLSNPKPWIDPCIQAAIFACANCELTRCKAWDLHLIISFTRLKTGSRLSLLFVLSNLFPSFFSGYKVHVHRAKKGKRNLGESCRCLSPYTWWFFFQS